MSSPDEAFARLAGRQATDEERQSLYRIRDALGIKSTDSLWILLFVLQHYQTLYERIPEKIARAAREAVAASKAAAEIQAKAGAEETLRKLTEGLRRTVEATARTANLKQSLRWIGVTVLGLSVSLVTVGRWEFHRGEAEGATRAERIGQLQRVSDSAASAWASTMDGRLAYQLAKAGSLRDLVTCSGRGLAARDGWCVAQGEHGRAARWRLPESEAQ